MTESRLDTYSEYERSRDSSGATAQQKRTTPTAAIRFMRAFLGSVNHQARLADRISSVGISDVQEMIHDIALWSVRRRKRERGERGRGRGRREEDESRCRFVGISGCRTQNGRRE